MIKKSLLFLTPRYWPARDGTALHFQALAERFAQDGYQVDVLTADPLEIEGFLDGRQKKISISEEVFGGVKIKRLPAQHLPFHATFMNWLAKIPGRRSKIFFGPPHAYLPGLMRTVGKISQKYSAVVAGVLPYRLFFYAAERLKKKNKTPLVGLPLIHLGEPARPELRESYLNELNISLLKNFDLLLLNTRAEMSPLIKAGIDRQKLFSAGAGLDPGQLAGGDGLKFRKKHSLTGPIVFFIGTQTHDKGSHHLVEALKIIRRKNPAGRLVLAGEIRPDFEKYLSVQPPEALSGLIRLGSINDEEKKDLLAAGDIMAMPSRADSFGIAYLEAWFYKKPVIGCLAGGVPEVIDDGSDGFLVPFGDVHLLAEYLEKLLTDRELAQKMGAAGYQKVMENFTWDIIYQKVKNKVEGLILKNGT